MRHQIISKIMDQHPYEVVEVKLIAESKEESASINNISEETEFYLADTVGMVEVISQKPPLFVIKKVKTSIGFGK